MLHEYSKHYVDLMILAFFEANHVKVNSIHGWKSNKPPNIRLRTEWFVWLITGFSAFSHRWCGKVFCLSIMVARIHIKQILIVFYVLFIRYTHDNTASKKVLLNNINVQILWFVIYFHVKREKRKKMFVWMLSTSISLTFMWLWFEYTHGLNVCATHFQIEKFMRPINLCMR